jgi:hypothetical protein
MSLVMRIGGQARRVRPAPPNRSASPGGLERQIDERACRFYGLTADEIKLVEGAGK